MPEFDSTVRYCPVPGFPCYAAGSDGSIWSCSPGCGGRWAGKWRMLKPIRYGKHPYLTVGLYHDRKQHLLQVHRVVLSAFRGPCPLGMVGCHNNGDTTDNRIDNLRWDTQRSNINDKRAHGTALLGQKHHQAKLTDKQARMIRDDVRAGRATRAEMARRFNLSQACVGYLVNGRTWRHL